MISSRLSDLLKGGSMSRRHNQSAVKQCSSEPSSMAGVTSNNVSNSEPGKRTQVRQRSKIPSNFDGQGHSFRTQRRKQRPIHRRLHLGTSMCKLLALFVALFWHRECGAFRVVDENGTSEPFVPYEQGFVGRYGDPFTTLKSDRINEGAPGTPTYPRLYEGVHPRQICPGMVGPMKDGLYYCLGKEHGYCDRRSGTCLCNVGYQGISCQDCSPTHFAQGGLCYPKLLCPSDCNGAGTCHYSNGTCSCLPHRVGDDCSSPYCPSVFSARCAECTFDKCTSCDSGYYVDEAGGGVECLSCDRYDPRCTRCDENICLECTDPLLLSIRRSGARIGDPSLPFDELERELPYALEFGTQDPRFFASAESFDVVATASSPLNESSQACAQGVNGDSSWTCESKATSHRVCGHPGVVSFSSPEYRAFEDTSISHGTDEHGYFFDERYVSNGTVRITLLRTGGGHGTVGVRYQLLHGTTDGADVTPHAHYTTSTALTFTSGVVELSFLLSIHQDGEAHETGEYFDLILYQPWGGARLGAQQRTRVTIVDANSYNGTSAMTDHRQTFFHDGGDDTFNARDRAEMGGKSDIFVRAGRVNNATIVAKDSSGRGRGYGGDLHAIWVESMGFGDDEGDDDKEDSSLHLTTAANAWILGRGAPSASSAVVSDIGDLGGGNYSVGYQIDVAGRYFLHIELCYPGGLTGSYFSDSFFQNVEFRRIDRVINFTWGTGPVAGSATDFAGVSWTGRIRPDHSERFEFELGTAAGGGDAARLWIDEVVIVDGFERDGTAGDWAGAEEGLGGGGRGYVNLTAGALHHISIEYSERRGDAACSLTWSSPSVRYGIVPPGNLYWTRELGNSPRVLSVRSALTHAEGSEAFGRGLISGVAALPSTFTILPRDAFGNIRVDETDANLAAADHFHVVLEAVDYSVDDEEAGTLDGVFGAAGSGGKVVTGTVDYLAERGVYMVEYVPFVAGTHSLNVTFQDWLFEPRVHIRGSPFQLTVTPGEVFGRRSEASGDALQLGSAGVASTIVVRARDVVGNALWDGGDHLAVYAFHREVEAHVRGTPTDFGNGTYSASTTPTVAGPYHVSVALNDQEVGDSPYSVVIAPGNAHGPSSFAYGEAVSTAVATLDNIFYVQARDAWQNELWGPQFNLTADLFLAAGDVSESDDLNDRAAVATNDARNLARSSSVTFLGNGSGIALIAYVPVEARRSFLFVRVNGVQVSGSPFKVTVVAGPTRGANSTVTGTGLSLATAGKIASFTVQARDREANPAADEIESQGVESGAEESEEEDDKQFTNISFNGTLSRMMDHDSVGGGDRDNSTTFYASTKYLGDGKFRATYNATKSGNYSLSIVDASDGEHVVGSPFDVIVEPAQPFAPATLVWWDRQVAGSNVIHLQAVDFWNNNLTGGGNLFVARLSPRRGRAGRSIVDKSYTVEEGNRWPAEDKPSHDDTASIAAGFLFPSQTSPTLNSHVNDSAGMSIDDNSEFGVDGVSTDPGDKDNGDTNAHVADVGGGRYEITTATLAGSYWLEVGLVEAGGLWGTYYDDGAAETDVISRTPEAKWRTKGSVNFNWGLLSPETGVDSFGASPFNHDDTVNEFAFDPSTPATSPYLSPAGSGTAPLNSSNSSFFPTDFFSARFSGFVQAKISGEHLFRVSTDSSSAVSLTVFGQALFDDITPPLASADSVGDSGKKSTGPAATSGTGADDGENFGGAGSASSRSTIAMVPGARMGSVLLERGEMAPLQLKYAHTTGEAFVQLEWSVRTDAGPAVIPETTLFHQRPAWSVAINLEPASTVAATSTAVWPTSQQSLDLLVPAEVAEGVQDAVFAGATNAAVQDEGIREVIAGQTMKFVVEARDAFGNHRGVGGDSIQAYARGPGGVMIHGSVTDAGDGDHYVSAWPVVAGPYQMSVLISSMEHSRWALGYRSVEQAMAGAHVSGSPFRVIVTHGAVVANASMAYGTGIASSIAGGVLGTSAFSIRAKDSMGNRVPSGNTGDFGIEMFHVSPSIADDESNPSSVYIGEAVHDAGGEYDGRYNVTVAGSYALHITLTSGGKHISGSPFHVQVSAGPASAAASECANCREMITSRRLWAESTTLIRLSSRDAFGNILARGGETWYVAIAGEDAGLDDTEDRLPVVVDEGEGSYTVPVHPGSPGSYELQVLLLSRETTGVAVTENGASQSFGDGGLTAQYFSNSRLSGRPVVTRVDPFVRIDWRSGVPNGFSLLGSSGGSVGVRWDGFLRAPLSQEFTFVMTTGAGDEARLWLRDLLLIDTSSTSSNERTRPASLSADQTATAILSFAAGQVFRIRAEYIHHGEGGGGPRDRAARVVLGWESYGTPAQAVPSSVLYPRAEEIVGSPFGFSAL